jgi:hypothetical protein
METIVQRGGIRPEGRQVRTVGVRRHGRRKGDGGTQHLVCPLMQPHKILMVFIAVNVFLTREPDTRTRGERGYPLTGMEEKEGKRKRNQNPIHSYGKAKMHI